MRRLFWSFLIWNTVCLSLVFVVNGLAENQTQNQVSVQSVVQAPVENIAPTEYLAAEIQYIRDYYWSWYDSKSMQDWVLMANPAGASGNLGFDLSIAGAPQSLGDSFGLGAGVTGGGQTLTSIYPGVMGGPVKATSQTGDKAIVSQRSLLGNSFEEVLGTDSGKLSDHYYWPWYDQQSSGYQNWVLVANPSDTETVHAVISFTNLADGSPVSAESDIAPGKNWTPQFDGKMGGPVEVKAYLAGGSWPADARNVIASQRVLSNGGSAFNEVPGIPAGDLSDHYQWTWYDQSSPGARDWVLIANPGDTFVYYEVTVAGEDPGLGSRGTIEPGKNVTPIFPGKIGGPVEVKAYTDNTKAIPAIVIASQRVIWGPSFEEVPGYDYSQLASDYHWTWYDQKSHGSTNWVLVANPNQSSVYYEVNVGGVDPGPGSKGTIDSGKNVTPTFPAKIGGPVEVIAWTDSTKSTPALVMASQRVIWNGYFNEVLGTVLGKPISNQDTPPSFSNVPTDITVSTTDLSGKVVLFTPPTATDSDGDTVGPVSCSPPSGSKFPVGPTTVSCAATDSRGTSNSVSFKVTVNYTPAAPAYQVYGFDFSPFTDGQDPNKGSVVSEEQLRQRMMIVAPYTKQIRTFSSTQGFEKAGSVAHDLGLKAVIGAWLGRDMNANEREITSLIAAAKAGDVDLAVVGSEVLLRGDLSEAQLIGYISRVKTAVPGIPVTTADVYSEILSHPAVVGAVDVVFVNYYPFWEGINVNQAISNVNAWHQQVRAASGGKPVMVSETGWPSAGNQVGGAAPSAENASLYFLNFVSWARATNTSYFYFSALDEGWKAAYEGPQGAHWGVFDKQGAIKPGMQDVFDGKTMPDNWSGNEIIGGVGDPFIGFTHVPKYGSAERLTGNVLHVKPVDYNVAVYIYVNGGWWTKPTWVKPLTTIQPDGSWSCSIVTGGIDQNATVIGAYLVRKDYTPTSMMGGSELPAELDQNSVAKITVTRVP